MDLKPGSPVISTGSRVGVFPGWPGGFTRSQRLSPAPRSSGLLERRRWKTVFLTGVHPVQRPGLPSARSIYQRVPVHPG